MNPAAGKQMNPLADISNVVFIDFETRALPGVSKSDGDVTKAGTYRYAKSSRAIILTYAIGTGPVRCVETWDEPMEACWLPDDITEFHDRVLKGEAWYAAFNAGFDRAVWNCGTCFPELKPEHMIDVMAQVVSSNLPAGMDDAARVLRLPGKQDDGKELIKMFCLVGGEGTPQTHAEEWARFKSYAIQDTALLRDVWQHTRPLPFEEWQDYWVSERINERGVAIDLPFVEKAAKIAVLDRARSDELLNRWTNGTITAVTQTKRITEWAYDALEHDAARELMVKTWDEDDAPVGDEDDRKPAKLGLDRHRIEKLLAFFAAREVLTDREKLLVDMLTIRQFGGGSAPAKFQKILDQHDDGRLRGSYVFNGAQQTGRFSSKGVQAQNLTRSTLGEHEAAAIEFINAMEE